MPVSETPTNAEGTIRAQIEVLLERRGASGVEIRLDSTLSEELGMDSLELAELSAALEDELGSDPYTEGLVPDTVGEIVSFYLA